MAKKQTTTPEPRLLLEHQRGHDLDACAERYVDTRLRHHCELINQLSILIEKDGWDIVNDAYQIVCDIYRRIPVTTPPEYR